MLTKGEYIDVNHYSDIVLSTIEEVYPKETTKDNYRKRVLSGIPSDVRSRCGYIDVEVAEKLSRELMMKFEKATSGNNDGNGHIYLIAPEKSIIIDPSAGQFIPESSRVGYEQNFYGNMYIGSRNVLKTICMNGVINTKTQNDPELSFKRIWGETSLNRIVEL